MKGPVGSGKSTILAERYRYMVEKLGIPSEQILILLQNRVQIAEWDLKAVPECSGRIWRSTFYGFIQGEIQLFFSLTVKNCSELGTGGLKPVFMDFDSSVYLLAKVIDAARNNKGMFAAVTSYSEKIASELLSNIIRASASGIDYREIGERLYAALETKDEKKRRIYDEADNILRAYRTKCMDLGMFDYSLAVDLYRTCLLKDNIYREQLFKRVKHLIADNIEECCPVETDLIDLLLPNLKTCLLAYNYEGGCSPASHSDHDYMKERIYGKCDLVELKRSFTCSDFMYEFSEMLFDSIENSVKYSLPQNVAVIREPPAELRSEMLERIGETVCRLITQDGYKPSDIVILSTFADPVAELAIGSIIESKGYRLGNPAKKSRILDDTLICSLVTLAMLCCPEYGIAPARDDIRTLVKVLLKADPIRSSILAGKVSSQAVFPCFPHIETDSIPEALKSFDMKKYNYIKKWTDSYLNSEKKLPLCSLLEKAFVDIFVTADTAGKDISKVNRLIKYASSFIDTVSRFGLNGEKEFIKMLRGCDWASSSVWEPDEKTADECVVLSTPEAYLSSSLRNEITILAGISSRNWFVRSVTEFTNNYVVKRTWNNDWTYTDEYEETSRKRYVASMLRAVLKRCGQKLIVFESNLSADGYENNGVLSEYFDELVQG